MRWTDLAEWASRHDLADGARADLRRLFQAGEASTLVLGDGAGDSPWLATDDAPSEPTRWLTPRYRHVADLGSGAMGSVVRVYDAVLERQVALKVLHDASAADRARLATLFTAEARATAQLEHPNIVPIHDLGELPDGRLFFTMKEIRGVTFTQLITEVHRASAGRRDWRESPSGWTLRRLLGVLHRVCEGVAHAHANDVLHRDLKPDNVMVGDLGDVLIVDWGLALRLPVSAPRPVVAGTPAYMAPEQAIGRVDLLSPASDVFALGGMLHQVLTGRPPRSGTSTQDVLDQAQTARPGRCTPPFAVDEDLLAIRNRALCWEAADRFTDAREMAKRLGAWLDGALQRERAMSLVQLAADALPHARLLREQAKEDELAGAKLLSSLPTWATVAEKRAAWDLQDRAQTRRDDADLEELRVLQLLQAALTYAPNLPEAHHALAEHHRFHHVEAELRHDTGEARKHELLLRAHDIAGLHAGYLDGKGLVSLVTEPAGAHVELLRFRERDRQLVPEAAHSVGQTPLVDVALAPGSYLLRVTHPRCEPVSYPVYLERGGAWQGLPPGASEPLPVPLPPIGELEPGAVYVPAGWTRLIRLDAIRAPLPVPAWVDGFVMDRHPVTNRDYLAFLNALVADGRADEARSFAPRDRSMRSDESIYDVAPSGEYCLRADVDGDAWLPDYPVVLVDWVGASAYAAWRASREGKPWRLPTAIEWEKALRGADGRVFPWGNRTDPTFANRRGSLPGRPLPATIDQFTTDVSVYGVRGLGGNVRDWTTERDASPDATARVSFGGAWSTVFEAGQQLALLELSPTSRVDTVGFRLVRSVNRADWC